MKKLFYLSVAVLAVAVRPVAADPTSPAQKAAPVFQSQGNQQSHYKLHVGSMSAQGFNFNIDYTKIRAVTMQNPNPWDVTFASWTFDPAVDAYGILKKSTGETIQLLAPASTYFRILPGNTSGDIMITVEGLK